MNYKILSVLFILLLTLSTSFAILDSGNIKIFAVTEDEKGMAADLFLYKIPGNGDVAFITSNSLVGKDTQTTGNIALDVAEIKSKIKRGKYNYIYDIRANASEVDGPSAGAAMTLLAYSLLAEKPLPTDVGLTGTINSDGSVGVVGGVLAKAEAASEIGIKLFMIPRGEANQVTKKDGKVISINLLSYGPETLGMKIVEVTTIDDVLNYAYSNISDIAVDTNASTIEFIPDAIQYKKTLEPMKIISKEYITNATSAVEDARKELQTTTLEDSITSAFYPQLGVAQRNIEMSQIFLDQNYLYSAANYSFNARVLAGTIKEIAQTPSLLVLDSTVLDSKISSLRQDIALEKEDMQFIPIDKLEWLIGAQQRIAYAENSLKKIEQMRNDAKSSNMTSDEIQAFLFDRVYDYVSATAWVEVSKDFLNEAKKSSKKKNPNYSPEFINKVIVKVNSVGKMISDSNASQETIDEATRRYDSALVSIDNNFYFAALYDIYFSESFINSEAERNNVDINILEDNIASIYSKNSNLTSIWANLFLDHSKFFNEDAKFEESIGRLSGKKANLNTSFDLAYLSTNIEKSKEVVDTYIATTNFTDYIQNEPIVGITYKQNPTISNYLYILALLLGLLLVVLIIVGFKSEKNRGIHGAVRAQKINQVLNRLDKALSRKKIDDAEYFFMKKKYEDEYKRVSDPKKEREKISLSIEELKAKEKALVKGASDLERHYRAGFILPEDYNKQSLEVKNELEEIKLAQKEYQQELRAVRASQFSSKQKKGGFSFFKREDKVKGTEELTKSEEKEEKRERLSRRKLIRSRE